MTTIQTNNSRKIAILITAAGSSTRMGGGTKKEYLSYKNGTVLSACAKTFLNAFAENNDFLLTALVITCPAGGIQECQKIINQDSQLCSLLQQAEKNNQFSFNIIEGGNTRQNSVYKGLLSFQNNVIPDFVMIHDGARPFITEPLVINTIHAAIEHKAAVPGLTPTDTQKTINSSGFIETHLQRSKLTAVQTPQAFSYSELLKAHSKAAEDNKEYTDDTEIWGKYVGPVKVIEGSSDNRKITYPQDLINLQQKECLMHVGFGYDLHRLIEGRKLILGGVELPFEKGEDGHSDGDVLFHAITDAVLGASGLGDIGSFFPPEEIKWKDADSAELLKTVMEKIREAGWEIQNIDCVVKLEKPKFIPYRQQVIDSVANALGCSSEQVFVKAKTGEKLPPIGTSQAIEAEAVCLLIKK